MRASIRSLVSALSIILGVALLVAPPSPAAAAGSTTIAGAPTIPSGVQQFGNTSDGAFTDGGFFCDNYDQYWTLPVTAGDQVTVLWQADHLATRLWVYPVGTTDFNVGDTSTEAAFSLNSNGKAESTFTAARTGSMPVAFHVCDADDRGPYAFTATTRHAVVVSFAAPGSLPRTGTLQVSTSNPDGAPLTGVGLYVQARRGKDPWTTAGQATAAGNPTAVGYALPASYVGEKVQVRVLASGDGYAGGTSATSTFTVSGGGTKGGKGGKGGKVKVSLKASPSKVRRLDRVHLRGHTSASKGSRVTIQQRQVGGSRWEPEGRTRVGRGGSFGYSEVVHAGSRSYRACLGSTCSRPVLVRFLG